MITQCFLYTITPAGVLARLGAYATVAAALADQAQRQSSAPTNFYIIQSV